MPACLTTRAAKLCHLLYLVFANFLHVKSTIFPFVIYSFLVERYSEMISLARSSPRATCHPLTAPSWTHPPLLWWWPNGDSVFLSVCLYLLVAILQKEEFSFLICLFISVSVDLRIPVAFSGLQFICIIILILKLSPVWPVGPALRCLLCTVDLSLSFMGHLSWLCGTRLFFKLSLFFSCRSPGISHFLGSLVLLNGG